MPGPDVQITALVAELDGVLAFSVGGDLFRSRRGRTWERLEPNVGVSVRGVAYGLGLYVVVGQPGVNALVTSPNGRDWTPRPLPTTAFYASLSAVVFADGRFVAVGHFGEAFRSLDGVNWRAARSPIRTEITGVAYGAGRFVAVGFQGQVLSSVDGGDWAEIRDLTARLAGVCYGPPGFVAVGGFGAPFGDIWSSPDGVHWTRQDIESLSGLYAVTYGNGLYVAVGAHGAVWTSSDAVHWSRKETDVVDELQAVLALPGSFVAAGWAGAVLISEQ
jgi:photosystem II stability/assembly factor-like uncharacterized protein